MKSIVVTLVVLFGIGAGSAARAERFEIVPGEKHTLVRFESHAPMESFEGKTRKISGYVEFDSQALADTAVVYVEVDLASLDTGIPLRNRHMRENHLETAKYPKAIFRGGRLTEPSARSLRAGESVTFTLSGTFEIHGVSRALSVPVTAARDKDGALRVITRFPVLLSDYGIARPEFLMLKLDQTQRITFDVRASAP